MEILRDAKLSPCGEYRYWLSRVWDIKKPLVLFVGINPSTANAERDDITVKKLIHYCNDWGYGGFYIINLYGYITSTPDFLRSVSDPIGKENYRIIRKLLNREWAKIIFMWGSNGKALDYRDIIDIVGLFKDKKDLVYCFSKNRDGGPTHPGRLSYDVKLIKYF